MAKFERLLELSKNVVINSLGTAVVRNTNGVVYEA